ncbi:MAG TPA: hypothetical protein PKK26_13025 [Candidatus Wallbacteria bacterium]|nr:hypothetical protein [Candidatus Wallbacteria bacterium]
MLKYLIRYSFFIMLFIAISSATSFDDLCRDQDIDLHDAFSVKTLSASGFIITIDLHGALNLKTAEIKSCAHCFSIFHPPKIS